MRSDGGKSSFTRGYQHFWPYFMACHAHPWTQRLHVLATLAGGFCLFVMLPLTLNGAWLLMAALVSYPLAWYSHMTFEKNRPAAWVNPYWSLLGDIDMTVMMLTGTLDAELARLRDDPERLFTRRRSLVHHVRELAIVALVLVAAVLWWRGAITFGNPFGR